MHRSVPISFLSLISLLTISVCHADEPIEEIVVTSSRAPTALESHPGNIAIIGQEGLQRAAHNHIHELLTRVPGVWITRASGQESLPSIRSPVLTGAGSCGAFLTLENGVPTRPSGFCNVNQLFEIPTELAERIEVIRGPGNALYGSNALHGTINTLLPDPTGEDFQHAGLELGPNDFIRGRYAMRASSRAPTTLGAIITDDGGFREESGYRQAKGYIRIGDSDLSASFSFNDLDQETAGFILGEDAYKDPALNRRNLNPEAFRKANGQRLVLHWQRLGDTFELDVRPYARRSEMEFLQHFLPGQPLEENGHTSLGVLANARHSSDKRKIEFGIDVDVADVYLRETQFGPTEGSAFLQETRPEGKHYDYDVQSLTGALYVQSEFHLTPRLALSAGVRGEYSHYDYTNKMLSGNTRDDGTVCGFGGCLYSRPESRSDSFHDVVPKIGALWRATETTTLYANLARGFRAPQMTELYRLQSGQLVSDVDSEVIDSVEFGVRGSGGAWRAEAVLFAMKKKNSVYRDANGFNVSGGRSRHRGVELDWKYAIHADWELAVQGTYARHTYDFDVVALRGETFVSGRDVDTAPRWQGSAELSYTGSEKFDASLQWVSLGSYYLDAQNQYAYPGHDIANARASVDLSDRWSLTARLNNILDEDYADRADFAFGNYRYFPGRGREFYLQLSYAE